MRMDIQRWELSQADEKLCDINEEPSEETEQRKENMEMLIVSVDCLQVS